MITDDSNTMEIHVQ